MPHGCTIHRSIGNALAGLLLAGLAGGCAHGRNAQGTRPSDLAAASQGAPYSDSELLAAANHRTAPRPGGETSLFEDQAAQEILASPQPTLDGPDQGPLAQAETEAVSQDVVAVEWKDVETEPVEAPMDPGALATRLELIASNADDPVPAQFARALMPLIGFPMGSRLLEVDDFEHRTDLTESERQLLHATAAFSGRASSRLADGEPARQVLEEELLRLLEAIEDPEPFAITFATLIQEVRGLGDFTPRGTNRFVKGRNHDVRLYMDFEGVHWGFDGTNFSTELEIQVQVMKSDGYRVFSTGWESMRDSRARRVGVFAWTSFTLADDLEIGSYAIKIRVRQPETNNLAEHILPFEIVSRLAQGG